MPYIKEDRREYLNDCIDNMVDTLRISDDMSNEELSGILGDINYCFSRVLGSLIDKVTYPKVAMITGVVENIKQEFYRRLATSYEDLKINQNGDISEYKNARTR